jgi:hypothetical protein
MRHINNWLMQHVPEMPGEYSRLDMLDGLPHNVVEVHA